MNKAIILLVALFAFTQCVDSTPEKVSVNEVDKNKFIDCLMDAGNLAVEIAELKKIFEEAKDLEGFAKVKKIAVGLVKSGFKYITKCLKHLSTILEKFEIKINWDAAIGCIESFLPHSAEIREIIDYIKAKQYTEAVICAGKLTGVVFTLVEKCMHDEPITKEDIAALDKE
ncbi:MAG: hypothetical protein MJ252_19145 [archaeon]|nr:hypothetical protein [archaeon]